MAHWRSMQPQLITPAMLITHRQMKRCRFATEHWHAGRGRTVVYYELLILAASASIPASEWWIYSCSNAIVVNCMQEAEEVFAKAMGSHDASAFLHLLVAQYVRTYRKNNHVEMLHIAVSEVRIAICCNISGSLAHQFSDSDSAKYTGSKADRVRALACTL
jgi:hypothetical protein